MRRLLVAPRADLRVREAAAWLHARPPADEVVIIAASLDAASTAIRAHAQARGTAFGLHRFTLGMIAGELAKLALAEQGLSPIGRLPFEAMCTRIVDRLRHEGLLARLAAVVEQPGLPRALARTLDELRMAGAEHVAHDGDLDAALRVLVDELARSGLADRAQVFDIATTVTRSGNANLLLDRHVLLLDVAVRSRREQQLLAAILDRAPSALALVPSGDERTLRHLLPVFGTAEQLTGPVEDSLSRVQHRLFSSSSDQAALDGGVVVLSAPGESRECVEIARRMLREAEAGIPFDRMAVLLRAPEQYRVHLEEAFDRARIPAHFEHGTRLPDPSGRAFLALLACAREGLSARRFAEYLSHGEVPDATDAATPPEATPPAERWVAPDEELLPRVLAEAEAEAHAALDGTPEERAASLDAPVVLGGLRAPWSWERLLIEASVIGGRERWTRRLDGLAAKLRLEDDEESNREMRERLRADLGHLRSFALPLLDDLGALPDSARWGVWLDRLSAIATRALRRPERVLSVLANLHPMADVGPVSLGEVIDVLHERLTDLVERPAGSRYGRVFVGSIDAARGLTFDLVFVPGLAERMFPQKLVEDPLLLDAARGALGIDLEVRADLVERERLALRIAAGAASHRLVLSYPRIDLEQGRPRVPSFYGLEVLQAAEGTLPSFEELGHKANVTGAARIGWPAPKHAEEAIDEAEHDLAILDALVHSRERAPKGTARYLLDANPHLARALRTRARRWAVKAWKASDGLVVESELGRAALAPHALSARSFSPTALEQLSACPYRFALRTILQLEPRTEPEPIETLGPLERGSLIHEVQFELLRDLRAAGDLPVRAHNLDIARQRLEGVVDRVAAKYYEDLAPAIPRVWEDGIAAIRADLREWLRRMAEDVEWTPRNFELAFGIERTEERDAASVAEALVLDSGLRLRGSIDLVEQDATGALRATDYKTGKPRADDGSVIVGGASLQPVFYALALEKLFTGAQVTGGRLYFCTTRGNFQTATVQLGVDARTAAQTLVDTLAHHFEHGFFPAAPAKDSCKYCDFRPVCGPYEELRVRKKAPDRLVQLGKLRGER